MDVMNLNMTKKDCVLFAIDTFMYWIRLKKTMLMILNLYFNWLELPWISCIFFFLYTIKFDSILRTVYNMRPFSSSPHFLDCGLFTLIGEKNCPYCCCSQMMMFRKTFLYHRLLHFMIISLFFLSHLFWNDAV